MCYGICTVLVALFPGHSQILSGSCGEQWGEGLVSLHQGLEMLDCVLPQCHHIDAICSPTGIVHVIEFNLDDFPTATNFTSTKSLANNAYT